MVGYMAETRAAATRFVEAVASRDLDGLVAALAADARFRYLTPNGSAEISGAAEVAAKFLQWFGDADVLEVQIVRVEPLADRTSARYRFLVHDQDGWQLVEQQLYLDVNEERRIAAIDLLCSGFRPAEGPQTTGSSERMHRFDAGTLGCADGLAQEFRRQVLAIPVGDVLLVETSDPAAKEDLPPLARMMGHTVRSVEPSGNGRLLITVERGR
jgi:TusA-related sulfurtransferase